MNLYTYRKAKNKYIGGTASEHKTGIWNKHQIPVFIQIIVIAPISVHVLDDLGGGRFNYLRVGEEVTDGLKELRVIVPVNGTLIHDELAVNILMIDHLTVTVDLIRVPLRAEGDEHGQRAEVVDMVEDGSDTQRAKVRDYHGAVEGACIRQLLRQPAEVVHHAQDSNGEAQQEARRLAQRLRHVLGIVVAGGGLYLVYLLVHLAVNVEDGVGRLKRDLYGRLRRVDGYGALDRHDDLDILARVYAPADDEAVYAGQHGDAADIRRDYEVQDAYPLITGDAELAQAAIDRRDLEALLILVGGVVARGHYVRNEFRKGRQ